jgi:hypothetical protein
MTVAFGTEPPVNEWARTRGARTLMGPDGDRFLDLLEVVLSDESEIYEWQLQDISLDWARNSIGWYQAGDLARCGYTNWELLIFYERPFLLDRTTWWNGSIQTEAPLGNGYRLLDFTLTHKQLVYRAVGDTANEEKNEDHIFGGVEYINVPTSIRDMHVTNRGPASQASIKSIPISGAAINLFMIGGFLLDGSPVDGVIAAREYRQENNSRDFDDSGLRNISSRKVAPALDYEKQVISALSSDFYHRIFIPSPASGADVVVEASGGRRLLVEAKWFQGRPLKSFIRSTVMQVVVMVERSDQTSGVLIVLGGVDSSVADELAAHLRTALGAKGVNFGVLIWDPTSGAQPLLSAVGNLLPI